MDSEPPQSRPALDERGQALCAAVDAAFETQQVPFLRRLVDQPSHTMARDDVEAAARIVDELAETLGLSTQRFADPDGVFADHRVHATRAARPDVSAVALVGHVDTVYPRSLGFSRFTRDDGPGGPGTGDVIRGPGVLDMKSGLSAILFAIAALREVFGEDIGGLPLRFVCNSDEEVGSPSSASLFAELAPRCTHALVFEAGRTNDRIVTERKGGGTFVLRVRGRAAHAGNDHAAGINAIHGLSLLVPRIEAMTQYERGVTLNVGLVSGGTAKNTVPDEAHCEIDARFETVADANAVVAALEALTRQPFGPDVLDRLREAKVELEGGVTRPPMESSPASQALREQYERHAAAVGLGIGEAPRQGGGSDANLLSAHGVPSIDGLGPYGQHFHNPNEWSSLSSLRRRTQALACFLADIMPTAGGIRSGGEARR